MDLVTNSQNFEKGFREYLVDRSAKGDYVENMNFEIETYDGLNEFHFVGAWACDLMVRHSVKADHDLFNSKFLKIYGSTGEAFEYLEVYNSLRQEGCHPTEALDEILVSFSEHILSNLEERDIVFIEESNLIS